MKVDVEAEKRKIRELNIKLLVDHNRDVDDELSYFVDNAILMPPNAPPIVGVKAIRPVIEGMIKNKINLGTPKGPDWIVVSESGDLAYDFGKYSVKTQRPDGLVTEKGYYISLYKKIDGQWKFAGQSWSNLNL